MVSYSQHDPAQQLYDIYDMSHTPWWQQSWLTYCAYIAIVLLLLGILWYSARAVIGRKRVLTPWQKAIDELDRLETEGFLSVVYSKELYTALTGLLKRYIYERYGLDIIGKTDDEAIAFLEKNKFPSDLLESIRAIFSGSVIIKFSNACAIKAQIESDFAASRTIIDKTIPQKK
ncbi:DUF4381 family protein [Candidatus Dependentiae bacterium]|nr:DUF4381 family protein [Candidatus Dependentiae bacterium]MCC7415053.1 DUF4381 family protein [Campylobacterota bacterium]